MHPDPTMPFDLDPSDPVNYDQLPNDCPDCDSDIIDTWPADDWAL